MFLFVVGITLPLAAEAGLLTSLLGSQVAASNSNVTAPSAGNSQSMALLEANTASVVFAFDTKKPVAEGEVLLDPLSDVNIVSDTALLPAASPAGVSPDGSIGGGEVDFEETSIYVVHKGDTLAAVAKMFEVSEDTILSANDLPRGSALKEGEVLRILPFSGVEHTVVKGDTLQGLAKAHNISIDDIINSNIDLDSSSQLALGDRIIIPGGSLLSKPKPKSSIAGSGGAGKPVSGYYIYPLTPGVGRKTQGQHDRYAVDIGTPLGTAVRASAGGTVIFAKNGWNGGYGNVIFIKHPNGTETRYAHLTSLNVSAGAKVSQGQTIGRSGSTGRSTGPHLHFEVRGARNPGYDWKWAK